MSEALENLARVAVDCGFKVHEALGPGLLESVYEACLCRSLLDRGLGVERQKPIPIRFDGIAVHAKQVITYLRLMNLPLGLLMNFGAATFKDGVKRLINNYVSPFQ